MFDDDKPKRKRKAIPKPLKEATWKKYFGPEAEGRCYVCKTAITVFNFDAGHNKASVKGGKDKLENLRPICHQCNLAMGTMSIETYKAKHYGRGKTKRTKAQASSVDIVGKVQSYLLKQGFQLPSKKYAFDVLGKKEGGLFGTDKYLAVDEMETVTEKGIAAFMKKIGQFNKTISAGSLIDTPIVEGLVAHTGILPEGSKALVKGFKPAITFKKF
ncbi:MAG: HNH endonuclease [Chloroflexi bacterium]|nr:HNH endonuclease [Chloroflexota bacterium]